MESKLISAATYATYQKYGPNQAFAAISELLEKGDFKYFTNTNNNRELMKSCGQESIKDAILIEYLKDILESHQPAQDPLEEAIIRTWNKYSATRDSQKVVEILKKCLNDCIEEGQNHFTRDFNAREKLDVRAEKTGVSNYVVNLISKKVAHKFIMNELEKDPNVIINRGATESQNSNLQPSNINIYPNNVEQCRTAIMSGCEFKQEGTLEIGRGLYAASSIGNIRKNQEDAVLLITPPVIPDFKMMVVADGMGGMQRGEFASDKLVKEMENWFKTLEPQYYSEPDKVQESLGQVLKLISSDIYGELAGKGGSTFVGAIIGKEQTIISNVGDSRGYIVSGEQLIPVTEDHSYVNYLYKAGQIVEKDDMRFHVESNYITQHIGSQIPIQPNFYRISNKDYDSILLLSDGVTDCLSDNQILAVTRQTPKKELANALKDIALQNNSSKREALKYNPDYIDTIRAGKDNTTVAAYIKEDDEKV